MGENGYSSSFQGIGTRGTPGTPKKHQILKSEGRHGTVGVAGSGSIRETEGIECLVGSIRLAGDGSPTKDWAEDGREELLCQGSGADP